MKITTGKHLAKSDALILPLFEDKETHKEAFSFVMPSTRKFIAEHLDTHYFKAKKGETMTFYPDHEPVSHIILVGLGKKQHVTPDDIRRAAAAAIKICKGQKLKNLHVVLPTLESAQEVIEGSILGDYSFDRYITKKKDSAPKIESLKVLFPHSNQRLEETLEKGKNIAEAVCFVRNLANTPASDMIPKDLAEEAKKVAKLSRKITIKIFDKKKLSNLGMGLLLGVGQGSKHEPRLIILEYKHKKSKNKHPLIIVGKGITFDTGGINLKPTNYIEDMKMDMSGAATVLGLFHLLGRFEPELHIVGIGACAENNLTEFATKPGDIHTSYSGKTVEITNTDAEGRLVLGDALAYAVKNYNPEAIIDIATLTGGCIVALGYEISGLITNEQKLVEKMLNASKITGEKMWQLPLDKDLAKKVKGTISDLKNYTSGVSADAIMGAVFLKQFIGKTPWLHIDIAGTAWSKEDTAYFTKGATGASLRTLWKFLEEYES